MNDTLYLWLLERTDTVDWDQYKAAVVVARSAADAVQIHPDQNYEWADGRWKDRIGKSDAWAHEFWTAPDNVSATKVGIALDREPGDVVLAAEIAG